MQEKLPCKLIITSVGSELHTIPKSEVKQGVLFLEFCTFDMSFASLRIKEVGCGALRQPLEEMNSLENLQQDLSVICEQINGSGFLENGS